MTKPSNFHLLSEALARQGVGVDYVDDALLFEFPDGSRPFMVHISQPVPLGRSPERGRTCVMVAGIPRSGTSCVAGVLHHLGVRMGPFTGVVNEANPAGFFEHGEFAQFYQLFAGKGVNEDWRAFAKLFVLDDGWRRTFRELITRQEDAVGERGLWGFKSLHTLQLVEEFANAVQSEVRVVEVVRRLGAIRRSMRAYPGFEERHEGEADEILVSWAAARSRGLDVLTAMLGCPRLVLSYEAVVTDPEAAVRDVAAFVGVEPTRAAVESIRPELNRAGRSLE